MKFNKWTLGLAAVGVVSLTSAVTAQAESGVGNMNPVQSALSGISIYGAVDTSVEFALDPTGDEFASGDHPLSSVPFRGTSKQDGFNLNVVELNIEKPLDESEWASGFKVQLIMGPDAVGFNPSVNGNDDSDFGIKQAYVALRTPIGNGIDWKIGVFDTIVGYEVFESWKNPNFTRSWGWWLEPTEHTGILGTYRINDNISVSAGLANTLDPVINNRNSFGNTAGDPGDHFWSKTWMLSGSASAPDSWGVLAGSSLYIGIVRGFSGDNAVNTQTSDRLNLYVGSVINTGVTGLTTGFAFDYVNTHDDFSDKWYNLGAYVSYKVTEKLSVHGRGEYGWWDDDFGDGCYWGLTGTVQYDLWANVISRLEIRHEKDADSGFDNRCATALYLNLIYVF